MKIKLLKPKFILKYEQYGDKWQTRPLSEEDINEGTILEYLKLQGAKKIKKIKLPNEVVIVK